MFLLINKRKTVRQVLATFVFVTLLMHFMFSYILYHMHTHNISALLIDISAINQTKMQSTKHKSYTAQSTRSTAKSACNAEIKNVAHVKGDIYVDIGTQVQSLVYIIDKSLATKCYMATNGNFWMSNERGLWAQCGLVSL